jgi:6-phospho-3-hexuloisomerase
MAGTRRIGQEIAAIRREIGGVLAGVREEDARALVGAVLAADRIVVWGAGRMGMMARAFAMRLAQLGLRGCFLGDSNTPAVGAGDLLLLASGSGQTRTVVDVAELGRARGARLAVITARPDSAVGKMADVLLVLPGQTKDDPHGPASIQPMTTLNEQCLLILLDAIVLMLMGATHQSQEDLWRRHCNLE